ncbi:MAG: hypothetical protein VYE46_02780 [Cyanobacteriota bacterium]|nr:hypothetical protein [Cyanobacteriota bacterium]
MPQQPPPSHELWWSGWNVAVRPDSYVDSRFVELEVTKLLLLLGVHPPLTTSLFWRFMKAAVLFGNAPPLARMDGIRSLMR